LGFAAREVFARRHAVFVLLHLLNGIRHLFWDAGLGFELPVARKTGWAAAIGALVLTVVLWIALGSAMGGAA
jgi:succinate dehydrogenase cytochrome b556 subunit